MANKRVSELVSIAATELDVADLLLLSDVSEHESKKLQVKELSDFILSGGNLSGTLYGTASYAKNAATASYVEMISASYASTASWALKINTASYALTALSASYSQRSFWATTASYALTSSVELVYSSAFSDYARTASYLRWTPGISNGTASYALTASHVIATQNSTSYAATSSWAYNSISASRAISSANVDTASFTYTASYLAFKGIPNGTASYALTAANIVNQRQDYGMYYAITQSISSSQLDLVEVTPVFGGLKNTEFEIYGTVIVPFTSSNGPTEGKVELFVLNRQYGYSQSMDSIQAYANIGGGSNISGTFKYPFTMRGEASLYGLFQVYVTASNGAFIETSRPVRFKISSVSDQLGVSSAEPMQFYSYPEDAIMSYSSSLHPGTLYEGSASQVIFSGSYDATELLIPPGTVNILQYTWTLTGLEKFIADGNPGLTYLGGLPTGCTSASAADCSLTELPDMKNSTVQYLNVPNNNIVANLSLSPSMSYLDVSNNYYVHLPNTMPQGMTVLKADGIGITYTPPYIPDTLISMSFANCPQLTSWLAPDFPASLQYFDCHNSPLLNIPYVVPSDLLYVNISNCALANNIIGNLANGLDVNGLNNGYFAFKNNPSSHSAFNIIPIINSLRGKGWTIVS